MINTSSFLSLYFMLNFVCCRVTFRKYSLPYQHLFYNTRWSVGYCNKDSQERIYVHKMFEKLINLSLLVKICLLFCWLNILAWWKYFQFLSCSDSFIMGEDVWILINWTAYLDQIRPIYTGKGPHFTTHIKVLEERSRTSKQAIT